MASEEKSLQQKAVSVKLKKGLSINILNLTNLLPLRFVGYFHNYQVKNFNQSKRK